MPARKGPLANPLGDSASSGRGVVGELHLVMGRARLIQPKITPGTGFKGTQESVIFTEIKGVMENVTLVLCV